MDYVNWSKDYVKWYRNPDIAAEMKRNLQPGDHIYSRRMRGLMIYAHHGIYIGDNKVVHFTGDRSGHPGCKCWQENSGVILSCLDCFLKGGVLRQYKYGVTRSELISYANKPGSRTVAPSDPTDTVIRRAMHLLHNGFGKYHLLKKNCEDFALYCKTGLVVHGGASAQVLGLRGRSARYRDDIGVRDDKDKLPVDHIFHVEDGESSPNAESFFNFKGFVSS